MTYVKSEQTRPDAGRLAYYEGDLESAYEAYKEEFESAGYEIPFDEKEEDDAEVSYEDGDSGDHGAGSTEGRMRRGGPHIGQDHERAE